MPSAGVGRQWFPVTLFATFLILAASAVLLMLLGHGWWALTVTCAAAVVALPLAGWLVAAPMLEGFIVSRLRAAGGSLSERAFQDDSKLIDRLARRGVIRTGNGIVALQEEKVGRTLGFFAKLYSHGRGRTRGADRPN